VKRRTPLTRCKAQRRSDTQGEGKLVLEASRSALSGPFRTSSENVRCDLVKKIPALERRQVQLVKGAFSSKARVRRGVSCEVIP
jgi:hypothetical protein